jgi:flavin-dependent dehydrogenase
VVIGSGPAGQAVARECRSSNLWLAVVEGREYAEVICRAAGMGAENRFPERDQVAGPDSLSKNP